jgi:branched-chain amino acid transport system permease protein
MVILDTIVGILLAGMAYAMILYMSAVGLSVTMGLLGIANLAHGVFVMAGAYGLLVLTTTAGLPFAVGLILSCIIVGLGSVVLERLLYRRFYNAMERDQVVMSIGLIFISVAVARFFFGPLPQSVQTPELLRQQLDLGIFGAFPAYRMFLIVFGFVVFLALWIGIERTMIGARIRAAVDNRSMAQAVGINTQRLFTTVFALGSMLAALGGALGTETVAVAPDYPLVHLVYFLIVVAIGGLGSIKGPFAAAVLLGVGDTACRVLAPQFGAFFVYLALFVLLLVRPAGLFARS